MKNQQTQIHFKPRKMVAEISDASGEGFFADMYALSQSPCGSAIVRIPEFGLFVNYTNNYRMNFFAALFEAYDGKVISKSIKSEERQENLKNIPVSLLAYADYTLFKTEIKQIFENLLKTGFARRCCISFQCPTKLVFMPKTDEEERAHYDRMKKLGNTLWQIFQEVRLNSCYVLKPETKDLFNEYCKTTVDEHNNESNELIQLIINSKPLKALKLSGMYACIQHPTDLCIQESDMQQAINTVEYLGDDAKIFLKYKPKTPDIYDRVFDFFESNIDTEFKKTELINAYSKEIGISRGYFRKNFDEIIEIVNEIAIDKNFVLSLDTEKYKNGYAYKLIKMDQKSLSSCVEDLENLLNKQ